MTVRFRKAAEVGKPLIIRALVESARRMIQTSGQVTNQAGDAIATAEGKYLALADDRHEAFTATLVDEPATAEAARILGLG
jgi:hypothetical protein